MDSGLLASLGPGMTGPSNHTQRVQVGLQNSLLLLALVDVLLAQPHHDPQRLDVEAIALSLGINVADVVGDRLLLFLELFNALNEGLELVLGEAVGGLLVFGGGSGGHRVLLAFSIARGVERRRALIKPIARSSTLCTGARRKSRRFSALGLLFRMPPSDRATLAFGAWRAIRRTACRRRSGGSRPWSSAGLWRRPRPSSSWTGSCGRSLPDSSGRFSARRCGCAGARPAGGRRRLQARSCRR